MLRRGFGIGALLLAGCSGGEDGPSPAAGGSGGQDAAVETPDADAASDSVPGEDGVTTPPCPDEMRLVGAACIDRFEAPNRAGELPLVMYTFYEAEAWCAARDKRLCFDDEWTASCAGALGLEYPYGNEHEPGRCNDEQTWRLYDQSQLNGWPLSVASPAVESLKELLDAARAVSVSGQVAADHVEWLYQAEPAGENAGCTGADLVFDTQGNVEEWTRRRDGGDGPDFSGNLKGRYWAEARTCQGNVKTHGNGFRFYEIGFRCCRDPGG
jgi:formylglycine-generating enzyme required for sulfatase activity